MPKVIAETEEVLAIDKPEGLVVHSDGRTQEPTLADWILKEFPALEFVGEPWISPQGERVLLPGIVHRLDRTTSGVMLIAKTQSAYAFLKNEFKERRIAKVYRAFVYGHMESEKGEIVAEIVRSSVPPKRWFARPCEEDEKRAAITEWKLLRSFSDPVTGEAASYIEIYPKTGRTHQIRVHFASIGNPIVADHLYASDKELLLGFQRPALHAYSISLNLKSTKTTFTAPIPLDFPQIA